MQSIRSMFPLIFSLLLASSFNYGQTQRFNCNVNARPTDCVTIPIPVCAFPFNCNDYTCARTATNACQACSFNDIAAYSNGACPIVVPPEEEDTTVVTPPEEEEEPSNPGEQCPTTRLIQRFYGKLYEGTYCCGKRNNVCNWAIEPVCATLVTCIGSVCRQTLRNACQACKDLNVDYYFPVACPENPGNFEPVEEPEENTEQPAEEDGRPETETNTEGEGGAVVVEEEGEGEEFIFEEEKDTDGTGEDEFEVGEDFDREYSYPNEFEFELSPEELLDLYEFNVHLDN